VRPAGRGFEDSSGAVQPIMTDRTYGVWNEAKTALKIESGSFAGGHRFPRLFLRNINVLFVDGHVETRATKQLQWQFETAGSNPAVIPY